MVGGLTGGRDRAVSQVVGVILIVAIAVVLASTAGYYLVGLSDGTDRAAPRVAITAEYDQGTTGDGQALTVTFESGDELDVENVSFALQGAVAVDRSSGAESAVSADGLIASQAGSHVTASESVTIDAGTTGVGPGEYLDLRDATLRLVWTPSNHESDHSEVLWRWSPS